ncbi:MAG: hypothetical protein TREMPRED_000796 [Tremellales sp. Tagirdzhanova-0007]|nr:MAG: hypothetical protein TREMPRED_000796 [Tremellales sp. Tagirdzhanova-0007]
MIVTTLLPFLAVLASPALARTSHPNTGANRRGLSHHQVAVEHARNVEKINQAVERREELAQLNRRALENPIRRVQKRGASGCRTAAPSSTSSAAAAASSAAGSTSSSSSNSLTPNGIKAGLSAGDAFTATENHISWWYDWSPAPSGHSASGITAVSMLWGDGHTGGQDAQRLAEFQALSYSPSYIMGFYEPDCYPPMSSDIDPSTAAALWESTIVPHRTNGGSTLLSPGMCKQKDETWLTPFKNAFSNPSSMWDITAIHVNKNSQTGVQEDIDYYWNTYGKPIWVTEFACVDDSNGFVPCTDQGEINSFINTVVPMFESDSRVYGYAYSNGEGLGDVWPMWINGALSESGQTYINAISAYH